MVAHFTMRTYGAKQGFLFVTFGYIERVVKSDFFYLGKYLFYIIRAHSEINNHLM